MSVVQSVAGRMRDTFREVITALSVRLAVIIRHCLLVICLFAIRTMVMITATVCVLAMLLFITVVLVTMVLMILMVTMMVSVITIIAIIAMIAMTIAVTAVVVMVSRREVYLHRTCLSEESSVC